MSAESWKLDKDLCRCCHSEGVFKNLAEPHSNENQVEIYCDMMQQCLDITINPVEGPLYGVTYTICQECIQRLRDACSFKRQVTLCEQRFYELYNRNGIKSTPVCDVEVKIEISDSDHDDMMQGIPLIDENDDDRLDANYENGDTDNKDENDAEIKPEEEEEAKKARPKKARPKKGRPKAKVKQRRQVKKVGRPRKTAAPAPVDVKDVKVIDIPAEGVDFACEGGQAAGGGGPMDRYKCNRCPVLASRSAIERHVSRVHYRALRFFCPVCRERFMKRGQRKEHLTTTHGLEEIEMGDIKRLKKYEKFICEHCSKEYPSKRLIRQHMSSRHTLFKCPDCPSFFRRQAMPYHRDKVHGVLLPTCGVCGLKCLQKWHLILHQRNVHMREKNIQCPDCDMKFFDAMALAKHAVKHNPLKIFKCSFCDKQFPRKAAMILHEKIHKGIKDKICGVCGAGFVQKASLNYHMKKQHPEARF